VKNVELKHPTKIRPVFFADAMLGSIARKLRVLGFDTLYIRNINDDDVLDIACKQDRVILTCDKELFKRILKVGGYGALLDGNNDLDNLIYIFLKYGVKAVDLDTNCSRCVVCNGFLEHKLITEIDSNSIPPRIRTQYKEIFRCTCCNKCYWKGSQFLQLRKMAKLIEARLKSSS
jgi:uncharacterized protein